MGIYTTTFCTTATTPRYEIVCLPRALQGRYVTLQKLGTTTDAYWSVVEAMVYAVHQETQGEQKKKKKRKKDFIGVLKWT